VVKMARLPKAFYMFSAVPIKILRAFFTMNENSILKFMWRQKRPLIARAILSKSTMLEVSQYPTSNYTTEP
jgi:hypothetical protein